MASLRRSKPQGLTGIGIHVDGVSLARVVRVAGQKPRVTACEFVAADPDRIDASLHDLAQRYALKNARCAVYLPSDDYRLLMVDAPNVPAEELTAAMRWRVKGLLDFDIAEATLEVFDFPLTQDRPGKERSVYVVAAHNPVIQGCYHRLQSAPARLEIIDIAEMAQRNLAMLLAHETDGAALLSLSPRGGLITLSRAGTLFISRNLDVGLDTLYRSAETYHFERVALEIQRSLDYYTSHFRLPPIERLVLAPTALALPDLLAFLNHTVPTTQMSLGELLEWDTPVDREVEARCLLTLGTALRHEEEAA